MVGTTAGSGQLEWVGCETRRCRLIDAAKMARPLRTKLFSPDTPAAARVSPAPTGFRVHDEIGDDTRVDSPGAGWITVGAILIAVIVAVLLRFRSRPHGRDLDLGAVSGHWINEHRSEAQDHHR